MDDDHLEQIQFEGLIQGLIDDEYACCDDFINSKLLSGLRGNIQDLKDSKDMKAAGLGKKMDYQKNKLVRGDNIKWIEGDSENKYEQIYLKKMRNFIKYLNETCFTSINTFESHYASYEQKTYYKKHIDQFKEDKSRKFSIIIYLNKDWQKKDGGMLSLYPKGANQKDISPFGGRMVFFRSDEMEHEVQPSFTRERISIAGWFKN